jgi:haloalkane dehalogenase
VQRREIILSLTGAALSAGRGSSALAAASSPGDDDAKAARRHDRELAFAETPSGRIAYVDRGVGPAALFLHGFPLSSFQWRGAIDRLSPHRRCLAPDFMGLGRTEVGPEQAVTPAAQAEMLAAFLGRLGISRVDLIANDSGGAVAQLFVTRYPERVRTLLLTNCDTEIDSPPAALLPVIELARAGTYPDLWLVPWLNDKVLARSKDGIGGLCYANPAHPTDAALEQYLGPLVASPARKALVNRYTLGLTPNPLRGLEASLRSCTIPTRIVWGDADTIFSSANVAYLTKVLPKIDGVRSVPGAKLFFPEENPDIIASEARLLWDRAARWS